MLETTSKESPSVGTASLAGTKQRFYSLQKRGSGGGVTLRRGEEQEEHNKSFEVAHSGRVLSTHNGTASSCFFLAPKGR